ncbi:hypothetical protein CAL65_07635 [Alkalilimnicola ehrlichii]|uniref:TauD/TfdA-like domain-containing protein n=1 Tax=Alkalilimnicola ehrlichii TaxID=351052 RepID=A0A3E0WZK1_9GAMM|nr:hypothetical protein CAL65_07635 [Alkalilimnicola ehrlichii]
MEAELERSGGLLFTGFSVNNAAEFRAAVLAFGAETLPYMERAAVRREVVDGVFTSTEFSSSSWIDLHHEMSFARRIPARIFFFAEEVAAKGGETPVADEHRTTAAIDSAVRDEFLTRGLIYVRNFRPEIDMDWQSAFQTSSRDDVERYCQANGIRCEWISWDHLRTEQPQAGFLRSRITGERLFCNHAHIFHPAAMDNDLREALVDAYGEDGLPRNVLFGDGAPIPDQMVRHLRLVYARAAHAFTWKKGDVMMLDNARCLHGRAPFEGARTVLVSMTGLLERDV